MVRCLISCALLLCSVAVLAQIPCIQPPFRGVVTIVEPEGQFYVNAGTKDQLATGALLRIYRDGCFMGVAELRKVNRLDAIAQVLPPYAGLRLHPGDGVEVVCTPLPPTPRTALPAIEPNDSQRDRETLATLLIVYAVGAALVH